MWTPCGGQGFGPGFTRAAPLPSTLLCCPLQLCRRVSVFTAPAVCSQHLSGSPLVEAECVVCWAHSLTYLWVPPHGGLTPTLQLLRLQAQEWGHRAGIDSAAILPCWTWRAGRCFPKAVLLHPWLSAASFCAGHLTPVHSRGHFCVLGLISAFTVVTIFLCISRFVSLAV